LRTRNEQNNTSLDILVLVNVLLRSIDHANESQLERIHPFPQQGETRKQKDQKPMSHFPSKVSMQSVPLSIKSIFVITPSVRSPTAKANSEQQPKTKTASTLRIHLTSHLQSIRCGHVRVGGRNGQDDRVWLLNKIVDHLADLFFA
jgi:hypothetical protein